MSNSCIYELKCEYGHTSHINIQNAKFELLFESGILALKDGYYREAVFSFAAALERFYEFSLIFFFNQRILSRTTYRLIEEELIKYEALWKDISKQSERQLGAFIAMYYREFGEAPMLLNANFLKRHKIQLNSNKIEPVAFRNIVVHQGFIPEKEQAILYGEAVNKYIREMAINYHKHDSDGMALVSYIESRRDLRALPDANSFRVDGTSHPTFIHIMDKNNILSDKSLSELFQ